MNATRIEVLGTVYERMGESWVSLGIERKVNGIDGITVGVSDGNGRSSVTVDLEDFISLATSVASIIETEG